MSPENLVILTEKKCSGCKEVKNIDEFYRNKSTKDGHSIYCVTCSKINTDRYFERKKEKEKRKESSTLINHFFSNEVVNQIGGRTEVNHLMRLMVMENLCKSMLAEIESLKKDYIKEEMTA